MQTALRRRILQYVVVLDACSDGQDGALRRVVYWAHGGRNLWDFLPKTVEELPNSGQDLQLLTFSALGELPYQHSPRESRYPKVMNSLFITGLLSLAVQHEALR